MTGKFTLHVNGLDHQVESEDRKLLLDVIREDLELSTRCAGWPTRLFACCRADTRPTAVMW